MAQGYGKDRQIVGDDVTLGLRRAKADQDHLLAGGHVNLDPSAKANANSGWLHAYGDPGVLYWTEVLDLEGDLNDLAFQGQTPSGR